MHPTCTEMLHHAVDAMRHTSLLSKVFPARRSLCPARLTCLVHLHPLCLLYALDDDGSKSFLSLSGEPAESTSTATAPSDSSNSFTLSSRPQSSNPFLPSAMLSNETASSRVRTPNIPLSTLASNGRDRSAAPNFNSSSRWGWGGVVLENTLDWVTVMVAIIALAASEAAKPREAYIPKTLLSQTNFPNFPNSVPSWSVPMYSLVVPAVCFVLHSVILRRPIMEANNLVLGLASSVLITGALTNMIKCPVGRLRPDFNARCWPDGVMQWVKEDTLGGYANCTGDAGSVAEGRKSFPSGHSSWSASGLCYVTWFLLDRLQAFDGNGHPWRLVVASMPGMAAVSVGITRYTDYWHHASDVVAGLLLGCVISWLFYRQQRAKLAELDPVIYGGGLGFKYSAAGSGGRLDEDGMPLLPHAAQQGLPV